MACGGPNYIDIDAWSERLGLPYFRRYKRRFNFLGLKKYIGAKKVGGPMHGVVLSFSTQRTHVRRLQNLLNRLLDEEKRESAACFYGGLITFLLPRIKDKIVYKHDTRKRGNINVKQCCEALTFPIWAREKMEALWASDYTFEEFLTHLYALDKTNFDLQSAIDAYHAQGDDSMYSILTQACTRYENSYEHEIGLCHDLPILINSDVSDYVSGTMFPVCVTPHFKKGKWVTTKDGAFLVNRHNKAIDCARINNYCCYTQPLSNRLTFLSRYEGGAEKYIICWNWPEIVEAVGFFKGDVTVRFMGENLMKKNWNRFGPGGLIVGRLRKHTFTRLRRDDRDIIRLPDSPYMGEFFDLGAIRLDTKDFTRNIGSEKMIYSMNECRDWFELGEMCVKAIEKEKSL